MRSRGTRGFTASACLIVAMLGLLVLASGCGGGDPSDSASGASAETGIPSSPPPLKPPPSLPPKKLVVKELSKGTGAKAEKGDKVALHYYCIVWGSGIEYSNSWKYGGAPTFLLGERFRILHGFNLAVPGMREGGGREVQIPNTLVYRPGLPHPRVRRLDALVCKVYLVKVFNKKPPVRH